MSADTPKKTIPERKHVAVQDTWDLSALYSDEKAWEQDCNRIEEALEESSRFKGHVADSAESLLEVVTWMSTNGQIAERVMQYAFLLHAADGSDSANQRR
ncbi:MAG TPA: oligoendopeptidase F, partial [Sphaerochaeta sp.]|nr:oligoendopeptidase F [Sphaerochaeta sp.]